MVSSSEWDTGSVVGLWHFDEGSGNVTADSSGNGNNGTVNGAEWVNVTTGKALSYDGVDDYVNVTGAEVLRVTDDLTAGATIKPDDVSGLTVVLAQGELDTIEENNWLYAILISDGRVGYYHEYGNVSSVYIWTDGSVVSVGEWYRITVTRDATLKEAKIYVNETLMKTGGYTTNPSGGSSSSFYVGGMDSQYSFDGIIDEVHVWNEVHPPIYDATVGLWHLDEGTGNFTEDSSVFGNHGTIYGNTMWVDGKIGGALGFDGVDDYVDCGNAGSLRITGNYTIEAWIRRSDNSTDVQMVVSKTLSSSTRAYALYIYQNKLCAYVSKDGGAANRAYRCSVSDILATGWCHVAIVYTTSPTLDVYVNGVLDNSDLITAGSWDSIYDSPDNVRIGHGNWGADYYFNGTIDEVCVYNEERTAEQIRKDAMLVPLVGFWRFDDGTGTTAYDSSEYGNDGTLLPETQRAFSGALGFDGVDDYVDCGNAGSLRITGNYTIEAWIRRSDNSTDYQMVVSKTLSGTTRAYALYIYQNKLCAYVSKDGTAANRAYRFSLSNVLATGWCHVAIVYTTSPTLDVYVNGVLDNGGLSTAGSWDSIYDSPDNVRIGHGNWGADYYFNGTIDEVRVSNISRTSFNLTVPPSVDADTRALWHFNEETGNTAYDETGYDNDGAIYGATWLPTGPTWTTSGKYDGALIFDGVNDHVEVPDSDSLDAFSKIALEAWIYPNTVETDYQVIVHKHNHTGSNRSYYLGLQANKLNFYLSADGLTNYILTSATSIVANAWTHVAATSDGATMKLFINGVQDPNTLAAPATLYAHSDPLIIGAYLPDGPTQYKRHFNGTIDEVAVFNEVGSVHDVAPSSVTPLRTVVGEGMNCSIQIRVVVENHGEYPETFNVSLYYNSTCIENQTVSNLESKNFTILTFTWNTTDFAKGSYTIGTNAWPVLGETDVADNNFTDGTVVISIPGDVNGDHVVDVTDYQLVKIAIPSWPDSPNWNPNADLDYDDLIDVSDFQTVKSLIGTTDP